MKALEGILVAVLTVKTLVVVMLVAAVCRSQRAAWQLYEIEHPPPTAKIRPVTGTNLNDGVDISVTVTDDDMRPRWQVGDEFVAIPAPGGCIYVSKAYADYMGINGKPGKVVDG